MIQPLLTTSFLSPVLIFYSEHAVVTIHIIKEAAQINNSVSILIVSHL